MSEQGEPLRRRMQVNPPVFFTSAALIALLVVTGVAFPQQAEALFTQVQRFVTGAFGWFYIGSVAAFLIFVVALALGRFGNVKLGPDDAMPDYTYATWFAMLFSAGMGIGLMFFAVAEPVMHFTSPPVGEGGTVQAARDAMKITFFHWGVHAWAIYIVVGLSLAYFAFRHELPLTVRSALYPLIGERIHGPIGHTVDVFAVLGTMFGIATSLGLGVMQVNAGLNYLTGVEVSLAVQLMLIAGITLLATVSVASGLDRGVRRLSELNLLLALILMLFVLATGPTVFLLNAFFQNLGTYAAQLVSMTFAIYAYEPNPWIGDWTLFYWGWWISWSPFVGMFIARVSRGRSIREFIGGVLLVPAGFTFLWLTVFGDTALHMALADSGSSIVATVRDNLPVALFALLEQLPLPAVTATIGITLVVIFFVTSSDSGSLVIDMITSGGAATPPLWQRIFWALTAGLVAAVLLVAGGLKALQTAAIASALPFAVVMLVICYGLLRGLQMSHGAVRVSEPGRARLPRAGQQPSWHRRLSNLISRRGRGEVLGFIEATVAPALEAVAEELRHEGLDARVDTGEGRAELTVYQNGRPDFLYAVRARSYRMPSFAFPEFTFKKEEEARYYQAEVHLKDGPQQQDLTGFSQDEVIHDLLSRYERHMRLLHPATAR